MNLNSSKKKEKIINICLACVIVLVAGVLAYQYIAAINEASVKYPGYYNGNGGLRPGIYADGLYGTVPRSVDDSIWADAEYIGEITELATPQQYPNKNYQSYAIGHVGSKLYRSGHFLIVEVGENEYVLCVEAD